MSAICNSIMTCFGFCPSSGGEEYSTRVCAPNCSCVPVDIYRQTLWGDPTCSDSDYYPGHPDGDPRANVYPKDSMETVYKAVKNFDYEKYGFVATNIGWVAPNTNLAIENCPDCNVITRLMVNCTHSKVKTQ